jgi:hypothetical protein
MTTPVVENTKFHNMLATWIINHQWPLLTVEDSELVKIFKYLNPTVQLVKADTIKKIIIESYTVKKEELKVRFFIKFLNF